METIKVEVKIEQRVDVDVNVYEIIDAIEMLPMKRKWSYLAMILNQISVDISDLTEEQKETVKKFLEEKQKLFSK
jgi:serine protease inhibitor ecotin